MNPGPEATYIAFERDRRIASGDLRDIARAAKEALDRQKDTTILVFDGATGGPIDIDFRGTVADVQARLPQIPHIPATLEDVVPSARAARAVQNWAWSRAR